MVSVALGPPLQQMQLLHLKVLDAPAVLQQQALPGGAVGADGAGVVQPLPLHLLLGLPEVVEDGGGHVVSLV